MMKFSTTTVCFIAVFCISSLQREASASVFLPSTKTVASSLYGPSSLARYQQKQTADLRHLLRNGKQRRATAQTAMAIPGYGVAEQVFVGGFGNFLSIYNILITGRILLSWFPQAQGIGVLQPLYTVTDPFLNLFRGLIPPLFGLDFSPILAFFLLSVLGNATAAVGAELPVEQLEALRRSQTFSKATSTTTLLKNAWPREQKKVTLSLNL